MKEPNRLCTVNAFAPIRPRLDCQPEERSNASPCTPVEVPYRLTLDRKTERKCRVVTCRAHLVVFPLIRSVSQHLEKLDQPHRGPGCKAAYKDHLKSSDDTFADVSPAGPATHEAGLAVPEEKQSDGHGRDGPAQSDECVLWADEEVRKQRHEPANEVAQGNGKGAGNSAGVRGFGESVVEVHEE